VNAALDPSGSGIIPELIEIVGDASRFLSVAEPRLLSIRAQSASFDPVFYRSTEVPALN
jgi:hypothetical protein